MNNPEKEKEIIIDEIFCNKFILSELERGLTITNIKDSINNIRLEATYDADIKFKGVNTGLLMTVVVKFSTVYYEDYQEQYSNEWLFEQVKEFETKLNDIIDEFQE